ncbi:unnamed protein product, partial [Didymodactylos carnosus]
TGLSGAGLPLLAICCLAVIGLLVAAAIVLALIPVYLPRHSVDTHRPQSGVLTMTYDLFINATTSRETFIAALGTVNSATQKRIQVL